MEQTNLFHFRVLLAMLLLLLHIPVALSDSESEVVNSIHTDGQALVSLKPLMETNHVLLDNWTADPYSSVCSWMGVLCTNNSDERVLALKLSGTDLRGRIPPQLGNLSALVHLDLSNNSLEEGLPPEIGNLSALKVLDLSSNNLTGPLPDEALKLKNLTNLSLANNQLTGLISENISHLENLVLLDLSSNNLSGQFPGKSLEYLSDRKLSFLNVSNNQLRGNVPCGGNLTKFRKDAFLPNHHLGYHCPFLYSARRTSLFTCIFMGIAIGLLALGFAFVVLEHVLASVNLYKRLYTATNGFHENKLEPEGSFGSVYNLTSILPNSGNDGKEASQAVKVFKLEEIELKNFKAESNRLLGIDIHPNLTPVIGSCSLTSLARVMAGGPYSEFKALVMEFMPGGSLEKRLHSKCSMDIKRRLEIMIGVASGLEHLHERGLFHGDLKPSNVLLDEENVARLTDYGITKLEKTKKKKQPTSGGKLASWRKQLATPEYSDPEYAWKIWAKSDVYSFGITLMETFTRKRPTDPMFARDRSRRSLRDRMVKKASGSSTGNEVEATGSSTGKEEEALDSSAVIEVVDAGLIREGEEEFEAKVKCVSSILKLALKCSEESPEERMDIKEVVEELNTILRDVQSLNS